MPSRPRGPAPTSSFDTPKKGKNLSASARRGSPKTAPPAPIRKSTRVPNLDQPPPDLSGIRFAGGAKKLLKELRDDKLASLFGL
tara:strand:+ start:484 stop:735 length:252 start_codon:yes stop_codon:yes gene_type:complete